MRDILAILGVAVVVIVGLWMLLSVVILIVMPILGVFGALLGFG